MKIWRPRDPEHRQGYYGGMGSKRSAPIWTPKRARKAAKRDPADRNAPWRERRRLKVPGSWTANMILLAAGAVLLLITLFVLSQTRR